MYNNGKVVTWTSSNPYQDMSYQEATSRYNELEGQVKRLKEMWAAINKLVTDEFDAWEPSDEEEFFESAYDVEPLYDFCSKHLDELEEELEQVGEVSFDKSSYNI